jgi:hypothetical protein
MKLVRGLNSEVVPPLTASEIPLLLVAGEANQFAGKTIVCLEAKIRKDHQR